MSNRATYSLLELNQYIRRVLSLNFEEPLWIECEIGQASLSRGHWYLDLIQKEEDTIVAQCQAAMWANVYFYLKRKSPVPPEEILKQGVAVKLKVNVDYHERYGLKLIIEDIDSSFTIGKLEIQRQAILKEIQQRGLIRKNAGTFLPLVIQRLAVISSDKAAGYKDFIKHLEENPFGYAVQIDLFEAAMQGQQVEAEVLAALTKIEKTPGAYDAVAIIRGGGGRTDLAAFDNLALALKIADYGLPVFIGIGHEIDQSVLDLVAYGSLKTPTAVADFVIERNSGFENRLDELHTALLQEVSDRIYTESKRLSNISLSVHQAVRFRIKQEDKRLAHAGAMIKAVTKNAVQRNQQKLEHIFSLLHAMDPDQVLARGYTITSFQGKTLSKASDVKSGTEIQTTFIDGAIKSKVE